MERTQLIGSLGESRSLSGGGGDGSPAANDFWNRFRHWNRCRTSDVAIIWTFLCYYRLIDIYTCYFVSAARGIEYVHGGRTKTLPASVLYLPATEWKVCCDRGWQDGKKGTEIVRQDGYSFIVSIRAALEITVPEIYIFPGTGKFYTCVIKICA